MDHLNTVELSKLSGQPKVFVMVGHGPDPLVLALKRGCLSPEVLSLKLGARVMFTKNDMSGRFVNGTTGIVTEFAKDTGMPIVKTDSGRMIAAEPVEWSIQDAGRILARISQVPLRLAWAITIHKSQGMSLDRAHMDLSSAFEYGQGYVAISRVRTLKDFRFRVSMPARLKCIRNKKKDTDFQTLGCRPRKVRRSEKNELAELHGIL